MLNTRRALTPRNLSAAMFTRAGTDDGLKVFPCPRRARKTTQESEGRSAMVIGEEGKPQGYMN